MAVDIVKLGAEMVAVATVTHTFLPPWEMFGDFPRFAKYYKVFVYVVGYVAGNARSTVWPSISTANGTKPSAAAMSNGAVKSGD